MTDMTGVTGVTDVTGMRDVGAVRRRGVLGAGVLAGLALARPALAQGEWAPDRPLRLVVPFAPGGNTDGIGRTSAEFLAGRLGQPVVVENRTGGNGAPAAEFVTRSRPDGHTLFMATVSQLAILPALTQVPFDPERDFAPVSIMAINAFALAVHDSVPARNLSEFLELVRRQPGRLAYASAGSGSVSHLSMAMLLSMAGSLQMLHVPYRGGAPAMQDLLGGQVAAYFGNVSDSLPHMGSGRIRVLATSGPTRTPPMPDVPTAAEAGVPGFSALTWNGIAAPAGTPAPAMARLARELGAACADAGVRDRFARLGVEPVCSSPDAFRETLRADLVRWREAVRVSGATLD